MNKYLSLVKFSHTVFALPFALLGYSIGMQQYGFDGRWFSLIAVVLCMVFVRSAAMAFNRYLDRDIDQSNPRTKTREIPSGEISPSAALNFTIINSILFVITCYFINNLCFWLSPVALLITLGYSYTKRFTYLCHLVLGIGLALAPVGAYIAATGHFSTITILYGVAIFLWVAGFDIIYALQDDQFDKNNNLHSIPAYFGRPKALYISALLHVLCSMIMITIAFLLIRNAEYGMLTGLASFVFVFSLIYQHRIVKSDDLSRVDQAFFLTNGISSILYGALVICDIFIF